MVKIAKENGIKRFIYASTSSVYGVSNQKNVTEEHPLVQSLTFYNKYKGMCEPQLLEETNNNFCGVIFRPATACGYSLAEIRFVGQYTYQLCSKKKFIKVFGGDQLRFHNLHIADYCSVVDLLISADENKVKDQIFNVGCQNLSITCKLQKKV